MSQRSTDYSIVQTSVFGTYELVSNVHCITSQPDHRPHKSRCRPCRVLQHWEGPVVEAPFLWEQNGLFYLFYSANTCATLTPRMPT